MKPNSFQDKKFPAEKWPSESPALLWASSQSLRWGPKVARISEARFGARSAAGIASKFLAASWAMSFDDVTITTLYLHHPCSTDSEPVTLPLPSSGLSALGGSESFEFIYLNKVLVFLKYFYRNDLPIVYNVPLHCAQNFLISGP